MRARLDHPPVLQYDDPVRLLGLRRPVCHDQRRTPLRSSNTGSLDLRPGPVLTQLTQIHSTQSHRADSARHNSSALGIVRQP